VSSADAYHRTPWGKHWTAQLHRHEPRPVWVNLAHAFGPPATGNHGQGYRFVGEVRGELHEWVRTTAGWYGLVEFDPGWRTRLLRQLVPAIAIRPRDDDRALNGTRRR